MPSPAAPMNKSSLFSSYIASSRLSNSLEVLVLGRNCDGTRRQRRCSNHAFTSAWAHFRRWPRAASHTSASEKTASATGGGDHPPDRRRAHEAALARRRPPRWPPERTTRVVERGDGRGRGAEAEPHARTARAPAGAARARAWVATSMTRRRSRAAAGDEQRSSAPACGAGDARGSAHSASYRCLGLCRTISRSRPTASDAR